MVCSHQRTLAMHSKYHAKWLFFSLHYFCVFLDYTRLTWVKRLKNFKDKEWFLLTISLTFNKHDLSRLAYSCMPFLAYKLVSISHLQIPLHLSVSFGHHLLYCITLQSRTHFYFSMCMNLLLSHG